MSIGSSVSVGSSFISGLGEGSSTDRDFSQSPNNTTSGSTDERSSSSTSSVSKDSNRCENTSSSSKQFVREEVTFGGQTRSLGLVHELATANILPTGSKRRSIQTKHYVTELLSRKDVRKLILEDVPLCDRWAALEDPNIEGQCGSDDDDDEEGEHVKCSKKKLIKMKHSK